MKFPHFAFWPEKYWLDAYDLSDAEHGRYLRILIMLWNAPRCRIPNDDAWLGSKTNRSLQAVETEIKPILLRFCQTDGNWWWQARLLEEYQRCERLAVRSSAGGKALAEKKKAPCQTPARKQKQALPPIPIPIPTKEDSSLRSESSSAVAKQGSSKPKTNGHAIEFPEWWPMAPWGAFVDMRKRMRKPLTEDAVKLNIRELDKLRLAGQDPVAVIEQTVMKGWLTFYPVKADAQTNGHAKPPKVRDMSQEAVPGRDYFQSGKIIRLTEKPKDV